MGSEVVQNNEIPFLDFSGEVLENNNFAGHDQRWKETSRQVREALETHGCFVMIHDKIPGTLREEMLKAVSTLFDLSEETKSKHVISSSSRPYQSYSGKSPVVPFLESFGIDIDEPAAALDRNRNVDIDAVEAFTNLMWPRGNPNFCKTLKSMSSLMLQLNDAVLKMILESYGVEELHATHREGTTSVFRLMKYKHPPPPAAAANGSDGNGADEAAVAIGLVPHTDKNALTILCQNEVQGLEVLNKDGVFVPLVVPGNASVVIVGDALKAWSNGRLKAAKHRVVMSGNKERYSFGLFSIPKQGVAIEAPNQLVDDDHPLVYRPFKFSEFMAFFVGNTSDDALEIFAGI